MEVRGRAERPIAPAAQRGCEIEDAPNGMTLAETDFDTFPCARGRARAKIFGHFRRIGLVTAITPITPITAGSAATMIPPQSSQSARPMSRATRAVPQVPLVPHVLGVMS